MPSMLYVRQCRESDNVPFTKWVAYIRAPFHPAPSVYASGPSDALRRLREHPDCVPWRTRVDRVIAGYNLGLGTVEGARWYNRSHAYTIEHLYAGVDMSTTFPL